MNTTRKQIKWGDADVELNKALSELKLQKVDTIVVYYIDCIGYRRVFELGIDSCVSMNNKYLIWRSHGISYVKKFDGCHLPIEKTAPTTFLDNLYGHIHKFKISKLLYPQFTKISDGKKTKYTSMVDHSCHFIFEAYTSTEVIKQDVDSYALNTKYDDDGKTLNENYRRNQRSFLKRVVDEVKVLTTF